MSNWKQHPLSAAYPPMSDDEFDGFRADILENGLKESVVMSEGMVLDGWHRVQACQGTNVEIRTREYQGKDPGGYVISKNGHRRNLTKSQLAAAALKVREIRPRGNPSFTPTPEPNKPSKNAESDNVTPGVKLEDIAGEAGVSVSTMNDANTAKKAGLLDDVVSGAKSAKQAAKEARGKQSGKPSSRMTTKKSTTLLLDGKTPTLKRAIEEIQKLQDGYAGLWKKHQELTDELNSYRIAELGEGETRIELEKQASLIRTLESQRDEHMERAEGFRREVHALRKELGR